MHTAHAPMHPDWACTQIGHAHSPCTQIGHAPRHAGWHLGPSGRGCPRVPVFIVNTAPLVGKRGAGPSCGQGALHEPTGGKAHYMSPDRCREPDSHSRDPTAMRSTRGTCSTHYDTSYARATRWCGEQVGHKGHVSPPLCKGQSHRSPPPEENKQGSFSV